jgi:hypothetical protein
MRRWFFALVLVDGGENWRRLGATGFDPVAFAAPDMGRAVGEDG